MSAQAGSEGSALTPDPAQMSLPPPLEAEPVGVPDAGVVRNTALQFATQMAGVVFTGALTLYLVRELQPSGYGLYALAISISGLLVLPAGLGLPMAVGRFVADHRRDLGEVRAILALGVRLQLPALLLCSIGLFVAAGAVAGAYGHPGLEWPLRWAALAIGGRAFFSFLTSVGTSIRQARIGLWMAISESAVETASSIALVVAGAGAAGAVLGKTIGYGIGCGAGLFLTLRLLRHPGVHPRLPRQLSRRNILSYAGAMFLVDVTFTALAQMDILILGALLSTAAVGSFSAVYRILIVLGYLGVAVSGGVAPRLSLGDGCPDTQAFGRAIRYLLVAQGVVIAPMLVWSRPIVDLLLGSHYHAAAEILRVLTVVAFVSAPAALISVSVTYMGEGRRRVKIAVATLVIALVSLYALIRTDGVVGAAIADDIVVVVWVGAHLWMCTRLIDVDLRRLGLCCARIVLASVVMAVPLLAIGTEHLSPGQWIIGLALGGLAYAGVLLITRELTRDELRSGLAAVRSEFRSAAR